MKQILIQLVTAFIGSLGFGLLFGLRVKHLFWAAFGGMIAWGIYLGVYALIPELFLANLCASVFAVTYAELMAHLRKCPATLFVVTGVVPMVPGGTLYRTMDFAVNGDLETAAVYGHKTLIVALAIAAGISFVTVCRELRIKTRRSVRTFDGNPLSPEDLEKIRRFAEQIRNPYDIPVEFILMDAKEKGLSSPVLTGETMYVAGRVSKVPHAEEAFGFAFEELVLYAWSLGIGTTWIGGTMKRELFEKACGLKEDQFMPCVSPLGYPAQKMSVRETLMRKGVKAETRKEAAELFFDKSFYIPLQETNPVTAEALEMVRLAPSAVNRQPWRVVRTGENYHFYLKHDKGYVNAATGDLQKVDMGIALCHFVNGTAGRLCLTDPGIPTEEGTEYIATVCVEP